MGRSLKVDVDVDPVDAVRTYLARPRTTTAAGLAEKAVIAIDPPELRGAQVWPLGGPSPRA